MAGGYGTFYFISKTWYFQLTTFFETYVRFLASKDRGYRHEMQLFLFLSGCAHSKKEIIALFLARSELFC